MQTVRYSLTWIKAFFEKMNAGAGYEGAILNCIANTIEYYRSNAVIRTVERKT